MGQTCFDSADPGRQTGKSELVPPPCFRPEFENPRSVWALLLGRSSRRQSCQSDREREHVSFDFAPNVEHGCRCRRLRRHHDRVVSELLSRAAEPAAPATVIPLWPKGTPGAKGTDPDKDVPTLTICLPKPETATGAAVVVCPGGGYGMLAVEHEGKQVAEWLNSLGVAAFILKYRLGPALSSSRDA